MSFFDPNCDRLTRDDECPHHPQTLQRAAHSLLHNCAAISCPALSQGAIPQGKTWDVLDQSAKRFINDMRHVKYDAAAKKLHLSKIFDWFADDYLTYLKEKKGIAQSHISQYLLMYLDGAAREALQKTPANEIGISYFSYNKKLNEQN